MTDDTMLERLYDRFSARDMEAVLAMLHPALSETPLGCFASRKRNRGQPLMPAHNLMWHTGVSRKVERWRK